MDILFVGPVGDFNIVDGGYATAAEGMFAILTRMLKDENIDYINSVDCISTLNLNNIKFPEKNYDVVFLHTHPNSFANPTVANIFQKILSFGKRKYLSVVWETKPLPYNWKFLWESDLFTGFITPSKFVANQIIENTKKSVYYVPHFIDTQIYNQININDKVEKEDKFTVLFVGQHTSRKGVQDAILSYIRAFHLIEDSQLILKCHLMSDRELPLDILIKYYINTNCNVWKSKIFTMQDKLKLSEMVTLYQEASILLFPSRGEGFGLPIVEAMSVGIPVIYTNWSSCSEVGEAPGNRPVNYYIDEAYNMNLYGYEQVSQYAYPFIKDLSTILRDEYGKWKRNKKQYYEEVSLNKNIVDLKFGYDAIKNCFSYVIKDIEDKRVK